MLAHSTWVGLTRDRPCAFRSAMLLLLLATCLPRLVAGAGGGSESAANKVDIDDSGDEPPADPLADFFRDDHRVPTLPSPPTSPTPVAEDDPLGYIHLAEVQHQHTPASVDPAVTSQQDGCDNGGQCLYNHHLPRQTVDHDYSLGAANFRRQTEAKITNQEAESKVSKPGSHRLKRVWFQNRNINVVDMEEEEFLRFVVALEH